jgi:hypothetical protein
MAKSRRIIKLAQLLLDRGAFVDAAGYLSRTSLKITVFIHGDLRGLDFQCVVA